MNKRQTKKAINLLRQQAAPFRGVHLDVTKFNNNKEGVFRAKFQFNNVVYSLGYHKTAVNAALAVNKKAKSLFKTKSKAQANGYWNQI